MSDRRRRIFAPSDLASVGAGTLGVDDGALAPSDSASARAGTLGVDDGALAPSDSASARAGTVDVGGRVLQVSPSELLLGDAFGSCRIALPASGLQPGPWVVIRCRRHQQQWVGERVLERHGGELRGDGQRVRTERRARLLARRQTAEAIVREHFGARGFIEVHTPVRVSAPGTDVYLEPHRTEDGWLITSPEFHLKRLLVGGVPRVYEFAVCTRNDEAGVWHQPEFIMLEWYRAFAEMEALYQDTEQLIAHLARELRGAPLVTRDGVSQDLTPPFERISVREAFQRFAGVADVCDLAQSDEDAYFQLLVDRVEPGLRRLHKPVFLYDYPVSQAALARRKPDDLRVAERSELYLLGVELCNGYVELTDPVEQRQRFEHDQKLRRHHGRPPLPIDEGLLCALQEGMPPAAGNALGFERLLALLLNVALEDVMAFPRGSRRPGSAGLAGARAEGVSDVTRTG